MKINLKPNFNLNQLQKSITQRVNEIEERIYEKLDMVGIEFVNNARDKGDYTDRTGNLRSSIGYIIFKDGKPYAENFEESTNGTDKATGIETGKQIAMQADNIPKNGFALVVVAGMNYAIYVEAKSFDVISGSSLQAGKDLREALNNIII